MPKPQITIAQIGDYTFDRVIDADSVHYQCSLTADIDGEGDVINGATTTCMFLADGTNHLQHDGEGA